MVGLDGCTRLAIVSAATYLWNVNIRNAGVYLWPVLQRVNRYLFLYLPPSSKCYFTHSRSQDFLSFLFCPPVFLLDTGARALSRWTEKRRTEGTLSRDNFIVWLLIRVTEDRIGNHLVYFLWCVLDRFSYRKCITYYYTKLICKILRSDPWTTLSGNLKNLFPPRTFEDTHSAPSRLIQSNNSYQVRSIHHTPSIYHK